jgi:non-ribosomal peptide synthetase component F
MDATAQRTGSSQFMVLLAGLATLLHRHTGQTDMIIGTPVANRARSEFDEMIGCFVNTLPMRCDVGGEPTFADLLARVRRVALDAYAHEALPFDRMLDVLGGARPRAHHPLFTVMLVVQSGVGDVRLPAAQLRYAGELHSGTAQFDLTFVLEQVDATPVLSLEYATDLFDRATADRLLHQLERVLTQVVHDPDVPVHAVALLDREEREQILGWGTGPVPGADIEWPAYRVVEERCAAQPDALAVTCGDARLRYGELNMAANQLARRLLEAGVRAGTPVGVLLDRGVHSVVAMLAIGKSGGVYLPLDPAYPDERLRAMLADARPPVVICTDQERLAGLGDAQPVAPAQPDQPAADLAGTPGGDDPAYLIFTSGSTGQPKGVLALTGTRQHRGGQTGRLRRTPGQPGAAVRVVRLRRLHHRRLHGAVRRGHPCGAGRADAGRRRAGGAHRAESDHQSRATRLGAGGNARRDPAYGAVHRGRWRGLLGRTGRPVGCRPALRQLVRPHGGRRRQRHGSMPPGRRAAAGRATHPGGARVRSRGQS